MDCYYRVISEKNRLECQVECHMTYIVTKQCKLWVRLLACWTLDTTETIVLITLYSICLGLYMLKHVNLCVKCESVYDAMYCKYTPYNLLAFSNTAFSHTVCNNVYDNVITIIALWGLDFCD